jgi:predicted AlkP superfamily phosphohydrolase/phosphomutase
MTRTLFIGLDGATFTVLNQLVSDRPGEGIVMPYLKTLMDSGVRANLISTPNPLTPPAWVSIMTGRGPGSHGVMDFMTQEDKGDYLYYKLSDARDIQVETIWSIASREGKSVAALNFVMTAPPQEVNGSIVPGFIPWKHLRRNTMPAGLYDRLNAIEGFNPKELAWDFEREKDAISVMQAEDAETGCVITCRARSSGT